MTARFDPPTTPQEVPRREPERDPIVPATRAGRAATDRDPAAAD